MRLQRCADLIQQIGGEVRALPIPAVRRFVRVRGRESESPLKGLIDAAFKRPEPPPACGSGA